MLKTMMCNIFKILYRVKMEGYDHYLEAGDRVLIVANHISFLDAILLAAFYLKM